MANEAATARVLLSLFTNEQIAAIYRTCRNSSLESLALSDRERVADSMPPAILGFLTRNGYLSEQDTKELAWGFATIQYGTLNVAKDLNWWSEIYENAFGLSETYADKIAGEIETDDKIPGLFDQALDFLRRAYNFVVPEGIEISQRDKFDVDGMWEMQLAGRQTINLAKRAYSGLSTVRSAVLQGTVFDMLAKAESGDVEMGDVEIGDYEEFAREVVRAQNAQAHARMPEQGLIAPLLGLGAKLISGALASESGRKNLIGGISKAGTLASKLLSNMKFKSLRSATGFGGNMKTPNEMQGAAVGTGLTRPVLGPAMEQQALQDMDYSWESGDADQGDPGYDPVNPGTM